MADKLLVMLCCSPGPVKKGRIDETLGEDNLATYQGLCYNPRLGADVATLETVCRGQTVMDGKVVCAGRVFAVSRSYTVHPGLGSGCAELRECLRPHSGDRAGNSNDQTTEACGMQSRAVCGEFGGTQGYMLRTVPWRQRQEDGESKAGLDCRVGLCPPSTNQTTNRAKGRIESLHFVKVFYLKVYYHFFFLM